MRPAAAALMALLACATLAQGLPAPAGPDAAHAAALAGHAASAAAQEPAPPAPAGLRLHGPFVAGIAPDPRADDLPPGVQPLQFRCPDASVEMAVQRDPDDRVVYGCPYRIYDGTYSFGNPQVAVDPNDARRIAFVSLHGPPAERGPYNQSRLGQTHTTFTTASQGYSWEDQPIRGSPNGGYGESADIVMDADGRMYIAYLWSRGSTDPEHHGGTIGLFKADGPDISRGVDAAYGDLAAIQDRSGANTVSRLSLAYVEPAKPVPPPENATAPEGEPAGRGDTGEVAVEADPDDRRVVAVWHERSSDWQNDTIPYPAWIDAAFTNTSARNDWTRLPDGLVDRVPDANETNELIGPCMDASNAVAWDGKVFVACVADRGYDAGGERPRARVGDIDVWSIDPLARTSKWLATTGLRGGHPMLAANEDGYMLLASTDFDPGNGTVDIAIAHGWFGYQWEPVAADFGPELHRLAASPRKLLDAGITALEVSVTERTGILVYKEWQEPADGADDAYIPDENDLTGTTMSQITDFNKVVATFNPCQGAIAAARLQLGTAVDPANAQAYQVRPGAFNDLQDGLAWHREPDGAEVFYMAADDYGAMQFAAVVASPNSGAVCPAPAPFFQAPPVPVPQALGIASSANVAVAAGAAVAATAMVAYLLTVKRKLPIFTTAEDK